MLLITTPSSPTVIFTSVFTTISVVIITSPLGLPTFSQVPSGSNPTLPPESFTVISETLSITTTLIFTSVAALTVPVGPTPPAPHAMQGTAVESLTTTPTQHDTSLSWQPTSTSTSFLPSSAIGTHSPAPVGFPTSMLTMPSSLPPSSTVTTFATTTIPFPTNSSDRGPDASGTQQSNTNTRLSHILPAVLLPVSFLIILVCIGFGKLRKNSRWKSGILPTPFTTPRSTTSPGDLGRNKLVVNEQTGVITNTGRLSKLNTIPMRSEQGIPVHEVNDVNIDGNDGGEDIAEDALFPQPRPHTREREGDMVPVTRAEIQELQIRVAEIEAQRPLLPPPEYASENGQ